MSGPFVLVPVEVTDAMLDSSTIAEPAASETAWNAATNYAVGDEAILVSTHRVYTNLIAGVNATSPELALTGATPRWLDTRPTLRWAAFDNQVSTASSAVTPLTYTMLPGLINAIAFYGLDGTTLSISIKDAPGGTVVYTNTIDLTEPPLDYYDYYFGRIKSLTKAVIRDLVPYANPEVTISITAGTGVTVAAGMIAFGDLRSLLSAGAIGGTLAGAKAKPITYSYISTDAFGTTSIVRRTRSTDMEITARVPAADADTALVTIQEVLDIPAAWIGSDAAGFAGLNVFGLASGDVSYEGPVFSIITINVRGLI